MFPTKEEFIEMCKDKGDGVQDVWEIKWEFYCDNVTHSFANELITNHTGEQISEDEQNWFEEQSPEELWKCILPCAKEHLINQLKNKVPLDVVKKYADEDDLKELQRLEDMDLVENL